MLFLFMGSTTSIFAQTDVSSSIINPGFDGRSFGGWRNKGFQTQTNNEFEGKNYKAYAEQWVGSGHDVPEGYLLQTVTGLPNGQYRLTAAAHNIDQSASSSPQSGAFIVGNGQRTEVSAYGEYTVDFAVVDGTAEIGFRTQGCTGNWVACDNFRLARLSTDTKYLRSGLTALLSEAEALLSEAMQSDALSELDGAMAIARQYTSSGTQAQVQEAYMRFKTAIRHAANSIFFTATSNEGNVPTVTTDRRYAVGRNIAFGRCTVAGSNIIEQGFCYSTTNSRPTVADDRSDRYFNHEGLIHVIDGLQPATAYYIRPYAIDDNHKVGYGEPLRIYTLPEGNFSYRLNTSGDAGIDARIKGSMDGLTGYWNQVTAITGFTPTANYEAGVATADCSYGGWIRFGPNEDYQATGTAMHEALHGIGVGTHSSWNAHESDGTYGTWYGKRAARLTQFWDNNVTEYLTGGGSHNWATAGTNMTSFTVNGAHEDTHTDLQYYGCGLLAQAMCEDGMVHNSGGFLPGYCFQHDDDTPYFIRNTDSYFGLSTPTYLTASGTSLGWTTYDSDEMAAADPKAAWYMEFDPSTQCYLLRNAHTGGYMTYDGNGFTAGGNGQDAASQIHLHLGWWDAQFGNGVTAIAKDTYYLMHPDAGNDAPICLTATASNSVTTARYSPAAGQTASRWMILTAEEMTTLSPSGYDITDALAPCLSTVSLDGWENQGFKMGTWGEYAHGEASLKAPFIEQWANQAALGDVTIQQTVTQLPNGIYEIGGSFIATWQPDASVSVKGVSFFAGGKSVAVATADGVPERCVIRVEVTDGTLTYGFRTQGTNANWVAMDNLSLVFVGTKEEYLAKATAESPVRVPINNARMEESMKGWTVTGSSDFWLHTDSYAHFNGPFMESWTGNGALADGYVSQSVFLPEGRYVLQAAVNAVRQDSPSLSVGGVSLCLGAEHATSCHTGDGMPEIFQVEASLDKGEHHVGLHVSGTNANWVAWDNVTLWYYPPTALLVGDVNRDGSVTVSDVMAAVSIVLGKDNGDEPLFDHDAADVNRNGQVSIADVMGIVRIILL